MESSRKEALSVYIHWPFCKSKCPYCDFNSHVSESIDHNRFLQAYLSEIAYYSNACGSQSISSIFFGGGTPSLAEPFIIDGVISELHRRFSFQEDIEITMEANPTSIESHRFKDYKNCGVNRVSIGVQSFDSKQLKFLGREHSASDAIKAIEIAKNTFDNFSFDLIYTLPGQSLDDWRRELEFAIGLNSKHLSLYQLTIEKGTKFYSLHKRKVFEMPSPEFSADFYILTQEIMSKAKMPSYEISNYSVKGFECKHNIGYWQYNDYIGIGPGAHGRVKINHKKFATVKLHSPIQWLEKVESEGVGLQKKEELNSDEIRIEKILMGMRTIWGIDETLVRKNIDHLIADGLLYIRNYSIIPTQKGLLLHDSLIKELI